MAHLQELEKRTSCLLQFAPKLGLSRKTQLKAKEILENIQKQHDLEGKKPEILVGSAIYIASLMNNEKITQRRIANTMGFTEYLISSLHNQIIWELGLQIKKNNI